MAQFRHFAIPSSAKVVLSATLRGEQIPKNADGQFIVRVETPEPVAVDATPTPKQKGTGTLMFGGKANPDDRAAKLQLHKLIDGGYLPNNVFLVRNPNKEDEYSLRMWLDCDVGDEKSTRRPIGDWGMAGVFALEVFSAKWSFVMVYDNSDVWSFVMSGRTLDDRQSLYTSIIPKVIGITSSKVAGGASQVATPTPAQQQAVPAKAKSVATLLSSARQPSAMELALMKVVKS